MKFTRRGFLKLAAGAAAGAVAMTSARRLVAGEPAASAPLSATAARPNIVFIFADDMGYGDPRCYNPDSKCPTPNIDRLAAGGMKFTDAHAPVGVCVPSRYGLITGRYPFRSDKYRLLDDDATIATVVKSAGYRTVMLGKWHLGFRPQGPAGGAAAAGKVGKAGPAEGQVLRGGPVDHGFDYYFGIPASLDIPPYYYIENDRAVAPPTGQIGEHHSPGVRDIQGEFWRAGGIAPGFKHEDVLPTLGRKALDLLDEHHKSHAAKPLMMYLALPAPHTPWVPSPKFKGTSKCGDYGDYAAQVDGVVGDVLDKLDSLGMTDKTLVIFTSDNGPVWYPEDVARYGHRSVGPLRGMKADVWEGGNRMPFIARWPGQVQAGSASDETICFTDMMATFAELAGAKPGQAGQDSFSIVPVLLGKKLDGPLRDATVLQASNGMFAIRRGKWKLILGTNSGGFSPKTKPAPDTPKGQLYDISADLAEQKNLYNEKPQVVAELTALLESIRKSPPAAPLR